MDSDDDMWEDEDVDSSWNKFIVLQGGMELIHNQKTIIFEDFIFLTTLFRAETIFNSQRMNVEQCLQVIHCVL
jgi:hypothetical protein